MTQPHTLKPLTAHPITVETFLSFGQVIFPLDDCSEHASLWSQWRSRTNDRVNIDITRRKQAEQNLIDKEAR
jgi:hypothetical protein